MTDLDATPQSPSPLMQTPSQTVGPFFGFALPYAAGSDLVTVRHPHAIRLHGTVYDGAGDPVPDAVIEIWQADEYGVPSREFGSLERDGFTFTGFGRDATTRAGDYGFVTVKPGSVAGKAPYVLFTIFARGLTHHLFTRAYFSDEAAANETDAVLSTVGTERRATLLARADGPFGGLDSYRFDIRLQGVAETVFLQFESAQAPDA